MKGGKVVTNCNCCGGACCVGSNCSIHTQAACIALGGTYEGDGTNCNVSLCAGNTCPGDVIWPDSGTVTISCSGSFSCHGAGTIPLLVLGSCLYQGGFNTADCSNMPVTVTIQFVNNDGWYIDISLQSPSPGLCSFDTDPLGLGNLIKFTSNNSPAGTYSFDLTLVGGGPGTCHVDLTISPHL